MHVAGEVQSVLFPKRHHLRHVVAPSVPLHVPVTALPTAAQPVLGWAVAAHAAPIVAGSGSCELHRSPATQRRPVPQAAGAFQKSHAVRQTGFARPSSMQREPLTQPVETASGVHVMFSVPGPVVKHAPAFPAGSTGSQNWPALQVEGEAKAVQPL